MKNHKTLSRIKFNIGLRKTEIFLRSPPVREIKRRENGKDKPRRVGWGGGVCREGGGTTFEEFSCNKFISQ